MANTPPTVGRTVHCYLNSEQEEPFVAFVAFVHSDSVISVGGFQKFGMPFNAQYVKYGEGPSAGPRWCWPPRVS